MYQLFKNLYNFGFIGAIGYYCKRRYDAYWAWSNR